MSFQSAPRPYRTALAAEGQMPHSACRLVAIVVTHDRLAQLRRTLRRLLTEPDCHLERVVVVNNASTDGTARWLDSLDMPRLDVLHLPHNMGGAGGFALGLEHARRAHDPDWVLLMDDDARPFPGALAEFQCSDLDGWDAIAAAAYTPQGGICDTNRPTRDPFAQWSTLLRTLHAGREGFHLGPQAYANDTPVPIDGASFVGLFLSRRALELAGLPDRNLFIYGDDAIYTMQLSRAGGRMVFLPRIRFEHDTTPVPDRAAGMQADWPVWKAYYLHRNALILYRLAAGRLFWPICLIVMFRWALRLHRFRGRRRIFLRLALRGIWHGLRGVTATGHDTVLGWARR